MKRLLPFLIAAFSLPHTHVFAQAPFNTMDSVDINNISAAVLVHGDMWWNPSTGSPNCLFPKDSMYSIGFAGSLWMSGYDGGGNLHVAAQTYRQDGNDYWPGPLDGSDTLTYATSHDWAKIWKVNLTDIQTFLSLGTHTLTNTPVSILTWPGKGNTNAQGNAGVPLTITTDMAPFVDINGNGIYEPLLGEYPAIKGNQALWWVFSDNGPTHSQSNGKPLGIEVHAMAYAYLRGTLIDDVIYYDYNLINRSPNTYTNFRVAQWDNMVIQYVFGDHVAFDSVWRMGIAYIPTDCNGCAAGSPGNSYHKIAAQAAITMIVLPGDEGTNYVPAGSFTNYNNYGSIVGNPTCDTQYNNYMRAKMKNGAHFTNNFNGPGQPCLPFGTGPNTNYQYTGDPSIATGWSECGCNNAPEDPIFVLASNDFTLPAGGKAHIVLALIAADSAHAGCDSVNFNELRIVADTAWGVYHHDDAVKTITPPNSISIYPNPAHDRLYIENTAYTGNASINICNIIGQAINIPIIKTGPKYTADISTLSNGLYLITYNDDITQKTFKFIKE